MTVVESTESPEAAGAINDALAKLWEAGQAKTFERLEVLETVVAALVVGDSSLEIEPGIVAAHKLAGTLGMFGLPGGSVLAREIEISLEGGGIDTTEAVELVEKAARLRASIESKPADGVPASVDQAVELRPLLLVGPDRAYREALHIGAERFGFRSTVTSEWTGDPQAPGQVVMVDMAPGGPDIDQGPLIPEASNTFVAAVGVGSSLEGRFLAASRGIDLVISDNVPAEQALDIVAQELNRQESGGSAIVVSAVSGAAAQGAARALGQLLPHWRIGHSHAADLFEASSIEAEVIAVIAGEDELEPARLLCHALRTDLETRRSQIMVIVPPSVPHGDPHGYRAIYQVVDHIVVFEGGQGRGWPEVASHINAALDRESRRNQDRFNSYRSLSTRGVLNQLNERLGHHAAEAQPDGAGLDTMVVFAASAALADSGDDTGTTAAEAVNLRVDRAFARVFGRSDFVGQWRSGSVFALKGDPVSVQERLQGLATELRDAGVESSAGLAVGGIDGSDAESLLDIAYRRARAGDQLVDHERPNTVLVVEDDEIIATIVKDLVKRAGFEVVALTDGVSAAEALCAPDVASSYGLVLLDLSLPGIDGFDVLRRMAKANTVGEVPVMLLTARAGEKEVMTGFELGAVDYVAKPFSPPVLLSRIEKAMAQ